MDRFSTQTLVPAAVDSSWEELSAPAVYKSSFTPYAGRREVSAIAIDHPGTYRRDDAVSLRQTAEGYVVEVSVTDADEPVYKALKPASDTAHSLGAYPAQPTVTVSFHLDQNFRLLRQPEFSLTFVRGCRALDFNEANHILADDARSDHRSFEDLYQAALALHAHYEAGATLQDIADSRRGILRQLPESHDGGKAGFMIRCLMEALNYAAADAVRGTAPAGVFEARRRSRGAGQRAAYDPRAYLRVSSPLLYEADRANLALLKAQAGGRPPTGASPPPPSAPGISEARRRQEARDRNDFFSAVGCARNGPAEAPLLARILSSECGTLHERTQARRVVYRQLCEDPRKAFRVVESLIDRGVLRREQVPRGSAPLEYLISFFEGHDSPRETHRMLQELKYRGEALAADRLADEVRILTERRVRARDILKLVNSTYESPQLALRMRAFAYALLKEKPQLAEAVTQMLVSAGELDENSLKAGTRAGEPLSQLVDSRGRRFVSLTRAPASAPSPAARDTAAVEALIAYFEGIESPADLEKVVHRVRNGAGIKELAAAAAELAEAQA